MNSKDIQIANNINKLSAKLYKEALVMMEHDEYYGLIFPDIIEMSQRLEEISNNIFECVEELVEEGEFNAQSN